MQRNHKISLTLFKLLFESLVDEFTYPGSSVLSTESNISMRLVTTLTAIRRLSINWKSDLPDIIKRTINFLFIYCGLFFLILVVFVLFLLSLCFGQISPLAFFR